LPGAAAAGGDCVAGAIVTELRYEMKLVCQPQHLPQARSWIRLHPSAFVDAYPPRWVNTIYFDTPHLGNLNANLAGLSAREKLRMRWFGGNLVEIEPVLELKQKRNLLGRKKRLEVGRTLDLRLPWAEIREALWAHADPVFRVALQTMTQPTLLTRYWREYYVTPDRAVRCTLDCRQEAYDQRLSQRPNVHVPLHVEPEVVVIEVKAPEGAAERLWEAVSAFPIRRSRNSKYAIGLLSALTSV
jgi:hypothetical protein